MQSELKLRSTTNEFIATEVSLLEQNNTSEFNELIQV